MDTAKKSPDKVPFLERPIVRTILPIAGFVIICVLFEILTNGRLFQPKNISLLLSQSYMLLISSIGVFMVMTMGGLDFSQGSMLGVASIVVCYLSHYNMVLAAIGGVVTGGVKVRFYNIILGVMTYKVLSSGLVMLMMPTQLQQLILGIIFLIEVALFSDRKTGMIVK